MAAAAAAFESRYHAACRRYVDEAAPRARAGIVIGNDDIDNPVLFGRLAAR